MTDPNSDDAQGLPSIEYQRGFQRGMALAAPAESEQPAETDGCPCTIVGPCSYACSCAKPFMSGGCMRCAKYGSKDQRKRNAERIAAALEAPVYKPVLTVVAEARDDRPNHRYVGPPAFTEVVCLTGGTVLYEKVDP